MLSLQNTNKASSPFNINEAAYLSSAVALEFSPPGWSEAEVGGVGLYSFKTTVSKNKEHTESKAGTRYKDFVLVLDQKTKLASMRRTVLTTNVLLNAEAELESKKLRPCFFTFTYRSNTEFTWQKEHISECIRKMRQYYERDKKLVKKLRYVWVAEIQTKNTGMIHYHLLTYIPNCNPKFLPKPDLKGWWPHGASNRKFVSAKASAGYLAKYLSKTETKEGWTFPKGARTYGYGGLSEFAKNELRWSKAPSYVKAIFDRDSVIKRVPKAKSEVKKGGWRNETDGYFLKSPWQINSSLYDLNSKTMQIGLFFEGWKATDFNGLPKAVREKTIEFMEQYIHRPLETKRIKDKRYIQVSDYCIGVFDETEFFYVYTIEAEAKEVNRICFERDLKIEMQSDDVVYAVAKSAIEKYGYDVVMNEQKEYYAQTVH